MTRKRKSKISNQKEKVVLDLPSAKNYRILFTIISIVLIFTGLTRSSDFGRCFVLFFSSFFTLPALMFHHEVKKLSKQQQVQSNELIESKPKKDIYLIVYIVLILISVSVWFSSCVSDSSNKTSTNSTNIQAVTTTISEAILTTTEETTIITTTKEITVNPKYTTYNGDNPLMALKVKTTKIPKIDKNRGYIEISKDDFSNVTNEDYLEFCESVVSKNKGNYNYFTIDFGDGTGICYSGCYIYDATYGTLDDTGAVEEKLGSIQIDIENHEISSDSFNFAESENSTSKTTQVTTTTTPISTTTSTVTTTVEEVEETEPSQVVETVPVTNSYVLNTSTMKFHKSNCRDVEKIAPENYDTFSGSRDEVINMGYDPCGHCKP